MILILLLFFGQVDSTRALINNLQHQEAYQVIRQSESTSCEALELKGLTAINTRRFQEAERIYEDVFQCESKTILRKAYLNYADLQYKQFHFEKRLTYLKKAYQINQTNQLIRIISRHYFMVEADYEQAETWLRKHTTPETDKDSSGYFSTLAQLAESKRQYQQAIDYYSMAKISAQEANLFSYELFAAEGHYRSKRLLDSKREEKMINYIVWLILSVGIYYYVKKNKLYYAGINQPQD